MKQFDLSKGGDVTFDSESRAYTRLKDVWGVLVPEPLFLSESLSGKIIFLGLQLGRDVNERDDLSQWEEILRTLRVSYGIDHLDSCGRNFLFCQLKMDQSIW